MTTIKNAFITKASLGFDVPHGLLTAHITVENVAGGGSLGGQLFEGRDGHGMPPFPSAGGVAFIRKVLETVGVNEWGHLVGQPVRYKVGPRNHMEAIGHATKDRWFNPRTDIDWDKS